MALLLFLFLFIFAALGLHAEDGSRLWLRSDMPNDITLKIDPTMPDDDGYRISGRTVSARTELGLLYGRYALLRGEQGESHPYFKLRILNHWTTSMAASSAAMLARASSGTSPPIRRHLPLSTANALSAMQRPTRLLASTARC